MHEWLHLAGASVLRAQRRSRGALDPSGVAGPSHPDLPGMHVYGFCKVRATAESTALLVDKRGGSFKSVN
eukprot:6189949-Pleurochrysis_carterae.AAC.2